MCIRELYKSDFTPVQVYSQTGEEGVLLCILNTIGHSNKFLVDIGAGNGVLLSNTRLLIERYGYSHLLFDANNHGNTNVIEVWITAENICDLLSAHNCPPEFTLLSIDIDGIDYDVLWAVLSQYSPEVVIFEINGTIPAHISKKIVYNPQYVHTGDDYYGFSWAAAKKLATHFGYTIVWQQQALNVIMVRNDLLLCDCDCTVEFVHHAYHAHNSIGIWETV